VDQVREVMRLKHYSIRTERSYCDWITDRNLLFARPPVLGATRVIAEFSPALSRGSLICLGFGS